MSSCYRLAAGFFYILIETKVCFKEIVHPKIPYNSKLIILHNTQSALFPYNKNELHCIPGLLQPYDNFFMEKSTHILFLFCSAEEYQSSEFAMTSGW